MDARLIAKTGIISSLIGLSILWYGFYEKTPLRLNMEARKPIPERVIADICKDLAAIAKVESDYRPRAIGDNGKSFGLYQIQQRIWGELKSDSLEDQTDKAQEILETLLKEQSYYEAIKSYNGSGEKANQYRKKVLTIVKELEYKEAELRRERVNS
jgi:hypothetical protein